MIKLKRSSHQKFERFERAILEFPQTRVADKLFSPPQRGDIADRFSPYATGYSVRSRVSLEETFVHLRKLMTEEEWNDLGYHYTCAYPSQQTSINKIGLHMPKFIRETRSTAQSDLWSSAADLDLKIDEVFHAFKSPNILTLSQLAQLSDDSTFSLSPTAKIHEIGARATLIFRKDNIVHLRALEEDEYSILKKLSEGKIFVQSLPDKMSVERLQQILASWIDGELLVLQN